MRPGVMLFGMLIPLAVLVLVAYGFWELGRSRVEPAGADGALGVGSSGGGVAASSARSILDERFARGELDAEEYVRRRALLDGTVPSPPVSMVREPTSAAPTDAGGDVGVADVADAAPSVVASSEWPTGVEAPVSAGGQQVDRA